MSKRLFLAGGRDHDNAYARPLDADCEFGSAIPLDADRKFPPPIVEIDPDLRARTMRWAWAAVFAGYALLVLLLKLSGCRSIS